MYEVKHRLGRVSFAMVEVAYIGWSVSVQYPLDLYPFIREYIHDFSQMCHYCDIDDRKEREERRLD